jgi:restriction system protein
MGGGPALDAPFAICPAGRYRPWEHPVVTPADIPAYSELILPTVRAVAALGRSAKAREITSQVLENLPQSEEMLAISFPERPDEPVLLSRLQWGRSYAKLIGALESPSRGVFLLTDLGRELLALPEFEAQERVRVLDREFRRNRDRTRVRPAHPADPGAAADAEEELPTPAEEMAGQSSWRDVVLARLHRLSPDSFEEFVLYLLRLYGLELERVGGSGDEGIDGIGTAPISAVLSSRVAVQVKRYDPQGKAVGREVVALFQRDAQTKGAERAILVTLGKFSEPARKAAIASTPTVDLIDGDRLSDLILEQELGVRLAPQVNEAWFDRFD